MSTKQALDLKAAVTDGTLYRPPTDGDRIEAFIPAAGHENHAANPVALPNGDLLCAWFAGSAEGTSDVNIVLSRLPHGEARWTPPAWVSEDSSRSEQNPILFLTPEETLWLLYTAQETRGCGRAEWQRRVAAGESNGPYTMQWTAEIRQRASTDDGHTWGPVKTLFGKPGSFCRQPPVVLRSGEWLFPAYYSVLGGSDYSVVHVSADEGRTWDERPVPGSEGRVQASVVELGQERSVAFLRSRAADRIYASLSADWGRTWSEPTRTELPNNNSSIQALKLASGAIAIVYNQSSANDDPSATVWPGLRYPVTIALSKDGGETWPIRRHIDASDGFCGIENEGLNRPCSYPTIVQTGDGVIHVAYSYRGRQCIKYVRFPEGWIRDLRDRVYG